MLGRDLLVVPETGSTNTAITQEYAAGRGEGFTLNAERQTAGRGRLGRSFCSPPGGGLYMSLLLRPRIPLERLNFITIAAAVAVCRAIEATAGFRPGIKWVNDVYLAGWKVCGILTEAAVDFESGGLQYAVLGIGVNLREPEGGFAPELAEVAGALFQGEVPAGARTRLAAEILNRFFGIYDSLPARDFMDSYRERSLLTGVEVTYTQGDKTGEALVLGVDQQARLLVRLPDGAQRAFSAGEVQIKKDFLAALRRERGGQAS